MEGRDAICPSPRAARRQHWLGALRGESPPFANHVDAGGWQAEQPCQALTRFSQPPNSCPFYRRNPDEPNRSGDQPGEGMTVVITLPPMGTRVSCGLHAQQRGEKLPLGDYTARFGCGCSKGGWTRSLFQWVLTLHLTSMGAREEWSVRARMMLRRLVRV